MIGICPPNPDLFDPQQRPMAGAPVDIEHWASQAALWLPMWDGAGQTVEDISGSRSNGTLSAAGITWGPSYGDTGTIFSGGTSHFITVPNRNNINNLTAFTISLWIIPTLGTAGQLFDKSDGNVTNGEYACELQTNGTVVYQHEYASINLKVTTSTALASKTLSHVAITCDGTQNATGTKFYINGKEAAYSLQSNGSGAVNTTGIDLLLGCGRASFLAGTNSFLGTMLDFRLYAFTASPAQVADLYNDPSLGILRRGPQPWFFGPGAVVTSNGLLMRRRRAAA